MEISTIQDLPAHPLIVHIPVIGIPLCALVLAFYILRPQARETVRIPLALFVAFVTVATVMAAGSGEKLESMLSPENRTSSLVHSHTELGEQTEILVIIFGAATLIYLALDWYRLRHADKTDLPVSAGTLAKAITALAIIAIVLGAASTVWDVRAGHAGAKATWHDAVEIDSSATTGANTSSVTTSASSQ